MLYAAGLSDDDFNKPQVGISSVWYEGNPCNMHLLELAQKVKEGTVTAELKHKDGVTMRIEYRRDFSDKRFFLKDASDFIKNQDTFTVGFFYAFSSKTP